MGGTYIFQMAIPAVDATGINQRTIIQQMVRRDISISRIETKIGTMNVRPMASTA